MYRHTTDLFILLLHLATLLNLFISSNSYVPLLLMLLKRFSCSLGPLCTSLMILPPASLPRAHSFSKTTNLSVFTHHKFPRCLLQGVGVGRILSDLPSALNDCPVSFLLFTPSFSQKWRPQVLLTHLQPRPQSP